MSIQSEITRLQGLRNTLRTKLTGMGLVLPSTDPNAGQAPTDLEDCVTIVDAMQDNGAVSGSISTVDGDYVVPGGYHNGAGKVGIAAAEKLKLIAANIKAGITILGITGTYSGEAAVLQAKSVTPTKAAQTVTADDGYDALSQVSVGAIPDAYQDVTGVTAGAGDVLANKIIVDATGAQVAGTMSNNGAVAATIDGLTTMSYTVPAGYHSGAGSVTLTGDIETALAAI